MCSKCLKPEKPKAKTTGMVFNPWGKQEYVFYGHVFAETKWVKPGAESLIVTNRCRIA